MKLTSALATTILAASVAGGLSIAQPVAAATSSPVVALAAGEEHTCALYADGAVQCWGGNDFGQLGNPDVESSAVPVPVQLPADAEAIAIDTGAFHTCAVTRDIDTHVVNPPAVTSLTTAAEGARVTRTGEA